MPKNHIMRQEIINAHLLQFAKEGKIVVRLKGGDPSIFGRVGEEAETLASRIFHMKLYQALHLASPLVAMQVFLTHRDYSNSVTLLTGHAKGPLTDHGKYNSSPNSDTIAYYMGIKTYLQFAKTYDKQERKKIRQ